MKQQGVPGEPGTRAHFAEQARVNDAKMILCLNVVWVRQENGAPARGCGTQISPSS